MLLSSLSYIFSDLINFQPNSFSNESVKRELGGIIINIVKIQMSQI